jgi:hypothetical protein
LEVLAVAPVTLGITAALAEGVRRARAIHKALGLPMVIWRDGRVQWVDAETLEAVPEPEPLPPARTKRSAGDV